MPFYMFYWTDEIIEHLDEHDVSPDEFEAIVQNPEWTGSSRRTGKPLAAGQTEDGRMILCVYQFIDNITIEPITAYEIN